MGRLTADPQLRRTASGLAVTTIRIAVNSGERPESHGVVVWRAAAEAVCAHLRKGRLVLVAGRLSTRWCNTPGGERRQAVEIVARRVQFLPGGAAHGKAA